MTYKHGLLELSHNDEKKFLESLGMTKERLNDAMKTPKQHWLGCPPFKADIDRWIDVYFRYAESLSMKKKASLHRSINRLFFSLKEGKYISQKDHRVNREVYRKKYIIPESMKGSYEAKIWLKLAGAYTQALLEKNKSELERQRILQFENEMPKEWLNIDKAGYKDADRKRAFIKFVDALNKHWALFIDSYRNEVHGTVINNSPVAASLQSFLVGRNLETGVTLKRTNPVAYWPISLPHYATYESARQLFEAKKHEMEALKPILSTAAGGETTIYMYPRWIRLGYDGVDPTPHPPQRKLK